MSIISRGYLVHGRVCPNPGLTTFVLTADVMFRANPEHTGVFANGGIVPTNNELWRYKTGGAVVSSPAVLNGVVYIGSDKNLYAIDAVTVKEQWRFPTGNIISSSPAVSNGVVYVGSRDNYLYAFDAVTGKEKWRFATEGWVDTSPAVSNGVVYVGSDDKNLYAIDAVSGKKNWEASRARRSPTQHIGQVRHCVSVGRSPV